jgi:hypothetical protein
VRCAIVSPPLSFSRPPPPPLAHCSCRLPRPRSSTVRCSPCVHSSRRLPSPPHGLLMSSRSSAKSASDHILFNYDPPILALSSDACRYLALLAEVVTTVRKTEDSLNRLKKMRKSAASEESMVSDEEKLRLQIAEDLRAFGTQVPVFNHHSTFPSIAFNYPSSTSHLTPARRVVGAPTHGGVLGGPAGAVRGPPQRGRAVAPAAKNNMHGTRNLLKDKANFSVWGCSRRAAPMAYHGLLAWLSGGGGTCDGGGG